MSDSIIVRVSLDSYDVAHPSEKQTQVYVQIPEVARASWLLDDSFYAVLKNEPWPHVVDEAQNEYMRRGVVSDSTSAAARQAIVDWLLLSEGAEYDARYDAVQAAWEADQARQHPVARKLLEENERLRARVAELDVQVDRLDHLDRVALPDLRRRVTHEQEGKARWRGRAETAEARVAALELERCSTNEALDDAVQTLRADRPVMVCRICEAPVRWVEAKLSNQAWWNHVDPAADGHSITPKPAPYRTPDGITRRIAPSQALREDEPAAAQPLMVFRASHDSIVFDLYTTAAAAREHCETLIRRDIPGASLDWIEDEEDGVAELVAAFGEDERSTGYVVTSLEVASEYDPDGDE